MKETSYLEGKSEYLDKLKSIPGLATFKDENLSKMLALSKLRRYDPKETIIAEGMYDSWIYFLLSGEVRVVKEGKELSRMKCYGDLFGEMSFADGSYRSASVISVAPTLCLAMDGSVVERVDKAKRDAFFAVLYQFLNNVLSERLRTMSEEVVQLKAKLAGYEKPKKSEEPEEPEE